MRILLASIVLIGTGCSTVPLHHRSGATLTGGELPPVTTAKAIAPGDTLPKPKFMLNPVYPAHLIKNKVTGVVIVDFIVGSDGNVKSALVYSSPHPELSEAALYAILKSKFEPGTKDGVPVAARMRVPLTFDLSHKQ